MAKSEKQKIKLLRLYEYLRMESDENHPVGTNEIIAELAGQGIACERKTVYSDITLLKEYGYDIQKVGRKYYLAARELNIGQIRFLMDVTQSTSALTKQQTEDICYVLSMLAGSHRAELLAKKVLSFDKAKHRNDEVFLTVERINRAIENDKKVSFKYFILGPTGEREYGKNGERYIRNPVGLVFNGGYYYLVCHSEKYTELNSFRVDHITDLVETDDNIIHTDLEKEFVEGKLKNILAASDMWNTKAERVVLTFDREHIGEIFDKFSFGVEIRENKSGRFFAAVEVNLNDVFYGWVASHGAEMRIESPKYVREQYIQKLNESLSQYTEEN
ncbi:MAG: WYL domain-containing transcriptional regulator [Lachnospiraceae bacterium]|nr:WYL domain-containing transcriptional regulator [Lachnospiraceae bacterium]